MSALDTSRLKIIPSKLLNHCKYQAFGDGGPTVLVSQDLYDRMAAASEEELQEIAATVMVKPYPVSELFRLPKYPSLVIDITPPDFSKQAWLWMDFNWRVIR